jgi:transcriptional regulator with XRE-family HTH domain
VSDRRPGGPPARARDRRPPAGPASVGGVGERPAFGVLLREWRARRRVSQLDLAIAAEVSARHVSFLETGRSRPSRDMVLRLAEQLEVPLRDRDPLLLAAGFAPAHPVRPLDDPALAPVRRAVDTVLSGFEPYPALAVDRRWQLVAANRAVERLIEPAAEHLKSAPVNVLRLSLHPDGLAPHIGNLAEWRGHLLARLAREAVADPGLAPLLAELTGYPGGIAAPDDQSVAVPLRIGGLSFISTVTTFGTARDVTAAELSIEAFLPADAATASALQR